MITRLQLWGGHLLALIALLIGLVVVYASWQCWVLMGTEAFWWYIVAMIALLLAAGVGILATHFWNSKNERHYLRVGQALLRGRDVSTVRGSAGYHRKGRTSDPDASQGVVHDDAHG